MASKKSGKKDTENRRHTVEAKIENLELAKARSALTLTIKSRGEQLGEIEIGRGSLYWRGVNRQRAKRVDWTRFAAMMNTLAYGATML
jgi:hypothetical protein